MQYASPYLTPPQCVLRKAHESLYFRNACFAALMFLIVLCVRKPSCTASLKQLLCCGSLPCKKELARHYHTPFFIQLTFNALENTKFGSVTWHTELFFHGNRPNSVFIYEYDSLKLSYSWLLLVYTRAWKLAQYLEKSKWLFKEWNGNRNWQILKFQCLYVASIKGSVYEVPWTELETGFGMANVTNHR